MATIRQPRGRWQAMVRRRGVPPRCKSFDKRTTSQRRVRLRPHPIAGTDTMSKLPTETAIPIAYGSSPLPGETVSSIEVGQAPVAQLDRALPSEGDRKLERLLKKSLHRSNYHSFISHCSSLWHDRATSK